MSEGRKPSPLEGEGAERSEAGEGAFRALRHSPSPDPASQGHPLPPGERGRGFALSGELRDGTHYLPVRVYYEDTDFSGVVYHASYLRFLERGRTDLLRLAGLDQSVLHAQGEGLIFAVRRMVVDYFKPARMDDVLLVETRTGEVRGASLVVVQRILRGGEVLVAAEVRVAALAGGRPARIPEEIRAILSPRDG